MAVDEASVTSRLSQLLVAFTIELDNEFEHRMPHRTAADRGTPGAAQGPWLVSWAMWADVLRLVPPGGVAVGQLAGPYGIPKLSGLQRWGYLTLRPPAGTGPPPGPSDWRVELTPWGRQAVAIWPGLPAVVETRWRERFGSAAVDALAAALLPLGDQALPRYPSVVGHGLFANTATPWPGPTPAEPELTELLSWVVGRFTAEVEATSPVSAALGINVLRLLDETGVAVGELPLRSGVSREAVATAVGWLTSTSLAEEFTSGRVKTVCLTSKGSAHRNAFLADVAAVVKSWPAADVVTLTHAVEPFLARPDLVAEGLRPYDEGWRWWKQNRWQTEAFMANPFGTLPHHPMVLHRGGFPDGS